MGNLVQARTHRSKQGVASSASNAVVFVVVRVEWRDNQQARHGAKESCEGRA
jgi:hypothetical protein